MPIELAEIPDLRVQEQIPLSTLTRFGIGGPARVLADASTPKALRQAIEHLRTAQTPFTVIGGGSNLVASDEGFLGVVLRYTDDSMDFDEDRVAVSAGAILQELVDASIRRGLAGLHTMTGIPGWVGGAVYGNAGAYGHSIHEFVEKVRFLNERGDLLEISNEACQFHYRESIFKKRKDWIIVGTTLHLMEGHPSDIDRALEIRQTRDAKYPPSMKCAGSIFKNLLWKDLPESAREQVPASVVREGKVPSAYFLEQCGAKGMREGGIVVADYHANLIYNEGSGTASQVRKLVAELKRRVEERFGLLLEEEVQYV